METLCAAIAGGAGGAGLQWAAQRKRALQRVHSAARVQPESESIAIRRLHADV
jgi:hypothetical protein